MTIMIAIRNFQGNIFHWEIILIRCQIYVAEINWCFFSIFFCLPDCHHQSFRLQTLIAKFDEIAQTGDATTVSSRINNANNKFGESSIYFLLFISLRFLTFGFEKRDFISFYLHDKPKFHS
ncbi:hydroxysteroid 17-beta dehydrogenase [Sarcoptes scabiei]|nr:hydroxysteroid 17-beta dehydrogenase [Sarcoptes scabiei]